jgi:hypothetical protein
MSPPYVIRPMAPDDRARIADTWVHSYRASPLGRSMRPVDYTSRMNQAIARILAREPTVTVAASSDEPETIWGWVCWEHRETSDGFTMGHTLHYVWVSGAWRRLGIARDLLTFSALVPNTLAVSHLSDRAARILAESPKTRALVGSEGAPYVRYCDLLAMDPGVRVPT